MLVTVEWLQRSLPDPAVLVIEAGVSGSESALAIPSSTFVDLNQWEQPTTGISGALPEGAGNLLPAPLLRRAIEAAGVDVNSSVVVYFNGLDTQLAHTAPIGAARLVWALRYAGVRDVSLLQGGLAAWLAAGFPTVAAHDRPAAVPVEDFFGGDASLEFPGHPELNASTEEVENAVCTGGMLADVRSWEEFVGMKHDYSYFDALGRIPGAHWAQWGPSTYQGGDLWSGGEGSIMIDVDKVRERWQGRSLDAIVLALLTYLGYEQSKGSRCQAERVVSSSTAGQGGDLLWVGLSLL